MACVHEVIAVEVIWGVLHRRRRRLAGIAADVVGVCRVDEAREIVGIVDVIGHTRPRASNTSLVCAVF